MNYTTKAATRYGGKIMKKLIILCAALLAAATLTGCTADDGETTGCFVNGVYMEFGEAEQVMDPDTLTLTDPEPNAGPYSFCQPSCYEYVQENPDCTMSGAVDGSYVEGGVIYRADGEIYEGD